MSDFIETRAKALAQSFYALVAEDLAEHVEEIDELNAKHDAEGHGCCATHDFCDANEIMAEAFEMTFGTDFDSDDEDACLMWNVAWNYARRNGFSKPWALA